MLQAFESRFNAQNVRRSSSGEVLSTRTIVTLVTLRTDPVRKVTRSGAGPRHTVLEVFILDGGSADLVESEFIDSHTRRYVTGEGT